MTTPTRTWRVFQLALALDEPEELLRERACAAVGLDTSQLRGFRLARKSLDARPRHGKTRLSWRANVDLLLDADASSAGLRRALRSGRAAEAPERGSLRVERVHATLAGGARTVVVGAGPAGLFAALALARSGLEVTLVERGPPVEERARAVVGFHRSRVPDPEANLLFGEGGAGTYSDGKIYTRVDDALEVPMLEELVACGAPPEIVYDSRAHIGTDRLHRVLPALRKRLEQAGVRLLFGTRLEELVLDGDAPRRVVAARTSCGELPCDALFLAVGHSARDTWSRLAEQGVIFESRPFQLGLRVEHPQELIDRGSYGDADAARSLGAASYALVCRAGDDRAGVHSFCMCPGGRIVACVNEEGLLCTNGMSNSRHSSGWATSALVVTFTPEHFGAGPFDGVAFQRSLERSFFEAGGSDYTAPAQSAADFLARRASASPRSSTYTFGTTPGRLDRLLPEHAAGAIARALLRFDRRIPGFAGDAGLFVGVESRSSTPLRMTRDPETRLARGFANLHPIGEGAGYAGGISSAAIDGARSALAFCERGLLR